MVVRSIEAASGGKRALHPAKERLVVGVHAQGDVRLASVPAEMTFPDQQADEKPNVELRHAATPCCFTVM
jgi:hypothetical protein